MMPLLDTARTVWPPDSKGHPAYAPAVAVIPRQKRRSLRLIMFSQKPPRIRKLARLGKFISLLAAMGVIGRGVTLFPTGGRFGMKHEIEEQNNGWRKAKGVR